MISKEKKASLKLSPFFTYRISVIRISLISKKKNKVFIIKFAQIFSNLPE